MNVFKSKSAASPATPKPAALLKMNVFKTAAKHQSSSAPVSSVTTGGTAVSAKRGRDDPPMSTAQRLIMEDQERKKRG